MESLRHNFSDSTNVAGVWLTAWACAGAIRRQLRYECQVFRLFWDFRCETSLDKDIWASDKKAWERMRKSVTLCDEGTVRLESDKLEATRRGYHRNGKKLSFEEGYKEKLPEDGVKMIYSSDLLRGAGESIMMDIESWRPCPHFVKRENGLFESKEIRLPVRMVMEVRAEDKGGRVMLISDLTLLLRWASKREPVRGANLSVGRPILQEQNN